MKFVLPLTARTNGAQVVRAFPPAPKDSALVMRGRSLIASTSPHSTISVHISNNQYT